MHFDYEGAEKSFGAGGVATLLVDDKEVARGRIEKTLPFRMSLDETFDVGAVRTQCLLILYCRQCN